MSGDLLSADSTAIDILLLRDLSAVPDSVNCDISHLPAIRVSSLAWHEFY